MKAHPTSLNGFLLRAALLALCPLSLGSVMQAQDRVHYGRTQLQKMMREANTADQCRTLVTWFRQEEAHFLDKAQQENAEYERLRQSSVPAKFPRPQDSAQSLRDYYNRKSQKMALLADQFEIRLSRLDPSYHPAPKPTNIAAHPESEKMLLERIERLERQVAQGSHP